VLYTVALINHYTTTLSFEGAKQTKNTGDTVGLCDESIGHVTCICKQEGCCKQRMVDIAP